VAKRFMAVTTSVLARGAASLPNAQAAMAQAGLQYPVIVKPDLGWCGFGVRRIDTEAELAAYLDAYPSGERVVLQEWLDEPGEAGIFYMRDPGEATGQVIGLLLRHYPRVTGDGRRTVAQLMAADTRARRLGADGASEPCCDSGMVPGRGQSVRIATVSSTRVGGLYEDATARITPALTAAVDAIARDMKDFHVGRFDVKFSDPAELAAGRGFRILEVNGAGSEAVHAWDPSLTLRQAYAIVFAKQRRLFAIGDAMRRRGHVPVGPIALARHHLHQQALIRRYPPSN
jgi:glutathione synthase/RimK-type ligase-like ATP-grasp enzyme